MNTRVLLLTSTLGSGHLRAAHAVEAGLLDRSPTPTVQRIDFWSLMDAGVAQTMRQIYLRLVQERPELYDRRKLPRSERFQSTAMLPSAT